MEERSRDDEISQKAFIHLSTHIFISIGTQRAFFPIRRHLRFFLDFVVVLSLFSLSYMLFLFVIFQQWLLSLLYNLGRKNQLDECCVCQNCGCVSLSTAVFGFYFVFVYFCSLFTPTLELLCLMVLSVVLLSKYECFYRFFGYSRVRDLLCLDLAELL